MFRKLFAILVTFSVLALPIFHSSALAQNPPNTDASPEKQNCIEKMREAVENFEKGLAAQLPLLGLFAVQVEMLAQNDLMCSEPEWMGNAVVTIRNYRNTETWYGIFHIHFLPDGTFRSAASINDTPWALMKNAQDWQKDWCALLKTVYPDDFKKECVATSAAP